VSLSHFEHPLRLWGLAAVAVIGLLMVRSRWLSRHALSGRPALWASASGARAERALRDGALLGVLALLTVAAAGPGAGPPARPLLVAVDVSASMAARDSGENRLRSAIALLEGVLPHLAGRSVALLAFAGEARLLTPLTLDIGAVQLAASGLEPAALSPQGSDLAAAVDAALQAIPEGAAADLLLLTDGEATEGDTAAAVRDARRAGLRVHAIGFGTPAGATIPLGEPAGSEKRDKQGRVVVTRLDEPALRALATGTGGVFERWDGTAAVERTRSLLSSSAGSAGRPRVEHWLLALALLLLVLEMCLARPHLRLSLGSARRVVPATALLLVAPAIVESQSAWLEARRGASAYDEARFEAAVDAYHKAAARSRDSWQTWFGLGCAQLRSGRLTEALASVTAAAARTRSPSDAALVQYNRGEILVRLDRLAEAAEAYREVLRRVPDDDARHNLAVVLERLRRREPPSPAPADAPPPEAAAPTSERQAPSADVAERLLREIERRQRQKPRRLPGSESPSAPESDKDW